MTAHLCPVCGLERTRSDGPGCDCAGRAASAAGEAAPPPHEPSTGPSPRPAGGFPSETAASGGSRDGQGRRGPEEGGSGLPAYGPAASAAEPDPASADRPARTNTDGHPAPAPGAAPGAAPWTAPAPPEPQPSGDALAPTPGLPPDSDRDHDRDRDRDRDREGDGGATMPLRPVHPAASLVALPESPASGPREEDLGLFGTVTPTAPETPAGHGRRDPRGPGHPRADRRADRRQRRRRAVAVTATAAAVAAVCAGVLAVGLSGGSEESDRALPDETPRAPTAVLPTGDAWAGSGRPSAPATGPASAAPTGSPSAAKSSASKTPEAARTADEGAETLDETAQPKQAPVLSKGMSGAEVLEMQKRLNQLGRSLKVEEDGQYNGNEVRAVSRYQNMFGVEGDPQGVYGPATRSSLESRTQV